jgi:hypothetical protein
MSSFFYKSYGMLFVCFLILGFFFVLSSTAVAAAVSGTNYTSQFRNTDYGTINWKPTGGTAVDITEGAITGDIWSTHFGWIHLDPSGDPLTLTCSGSTGTFTGSAWGEAMGFIDFEPSGGGVTLDSSGQFSGSAWNPNFGWITFSCPGASTCVSTSFTCGSGGNNDGATGESSGGYPSPITKPSAECEMSAIPSNITLGGSATLRWETNIPDDNLRSGRISNDVGSIEKENGHSIVSPDRTTTYTARFRGSGVSGRAVCSATVTVDEKGTIPINIIDTPLGPADVETVTDPTVGCLDPNARNYNTDADSHSQRMCEYKEDRVFGCTDQEAVNYNTHADQDNGSCQYPILRDGSQRAQTIVRIVSAVAGVGVLGIIARWLLRLFLR